MGLQVPVGILRFFKSWFGQSRVQENLLLTMDGRLVVYDLDVERGYEVSNDLQMAWGLDSSNQVRNQKTKNLTQVICEYDAAPIAISGVSNLKVSIVRGVVAHRALWDELFKIERDHRKNILMTGLIIIAAVVVIAAVGFMFWARTHGG